MGVLTSSASAVAVAQLPAVPPLGTVICAVDDSAHAAAVLYAASGLAAHRESKLIVLRIDDRAAGTRDQVLAARLQLNDFARRTIPGWLAYRDNTEFIVSSGDPAKAILTVARDNRAALIVIGTHGRGAGRSPFGSVSERILRETSRPVAVVPTSDIEIIALDDSGAVPHLGRVLVPLDLKSRSVRQLECAAKLSRAAELGLLLLHVVPAGEECETPFRKLERLMRQLDTSRGSRAMVRAGDTVDTILQAQRRNEAGVVVLGRDRSAPGRVACDLLQRTGAIVVLVP